jgi:hypothetical protein
MKKEILIHLGFFVLFFIFVTLIRRWFSLSYWPFWIGGIIGTILPDLDHLVYIYFLHPQELTSQRVMYLTQERNVWKVFQILAETRQERTKLIFHTAYFQAILLALTFLVVSSSASLFGAGLVLAFSMHLLVDQLVDYLDMNSLSNWFRQIPFSLTKEQSLIYWFATSFLVLLMGFFL